MSDDVKELQEKVLGMTKRVGHKARYRLLEMHARLGTLNEDSRKHDEATPRGVADRGRNAA